MCIFLFGTVLNASENMEGSNINEIQLESLLEQKIEIASKYEQKKSEAPASVIIISEDEIQRFCNLTFSDIISKVRGFYLRNDHNYPYIGVRGFERPSSYSNNILLLIDGHKINENVYGQPNFSDDLGFNVNIIERIEIVEGPGSTLYGTGAILAVINVITKKGKIIDGLHVSGEAGSHNYFKGDICYGKEIIKDLDFSINARIGDIKGSNLFFDEYNTPDNNNGIAGNLDWERIFGLYSRLSFDDFLINVYIFNRDKGIPTASYESIFNDPDAMTSDNREFIDLTYAPAITSNLNLSLRVYYDHYLYKGLFPYELNQQDESNGSWAGAELQFNWDITDDNRLVFGTEVKKNFMADYLLFDDSLKYFDHNYPYSNTAIFFQDYWQLFSNLSFNAGLSYNNNSLSGEFLSPRLSIIFNPAKDNTLKFLFGSAFRSPNIYEMFYYDDMGSIANLNLKPESINSFELVWENCLSKNIVFTYSVYYYLIHDLIDQRIITIDSAESYQFRNNKNVSVYGMEFDANFRFEFGLMAYFNLSHQVAKDDEDLYLTNSPKFLLKAGVSESLDCGLLAGADFVYESERITVYNTKTKPFSIINMFLKYSPSVCGENSLLGFLNKTKFFVKINNLFDVEYKLPGGFEHIQKSLIQYGRVFIFGLELKLF